MTTADIDHVDDLDTTAMDGAALAGELIDLHTQAGHYVAELSTSPAWERADGLTIRLIAEASTISAPNVRAHAERVPAVVRCRELAAAERRMVAALDGIGLVNVDVEAVLRVRVILAELAELCATLRR